MTKPEPRKRTSGPPRRRGPRNPDLDALAQAIEAVMAEGRLTHKAVSERSGINESRVGEYVRGQGNPTYTTLLKLAEDGLHVSLPALAMRAHELRMQAKRLEDGARSRPYTGRGRRNA